jgi:hypothetical protein
VSCHLLNDGTSTWAFVIIDEHIEDVHAVLNMCVAFSIQPAGVRFLQSQVVCILANHLGKWQNVAKWILHMHKH